MNTLIGCVLLGLLCVVVAQQPALPNYSQQYYVKGVFSIPYFNITEPLEAWYDGLGNRQVLSYYDSMDVFWGIYNENITYSQGPVVSKLQCYEAPACGGPTHTLQDSDSCTGLLINIFPNFTAGNWSFIGTTNLNGQVANMFQMITINYGQKGYYTFYTTQDGLPIQWVLAGVDTIWDSHPDIYIMQYDIFLQDFVNETIFNIPNLCDAAEKVARVNYGNAAEAFSAAATATGERNEHTQTAFHSYIKQYSKKYESLIEYKQRLNTFAQNKHMIQEHNAGKHSHTLKINHFADMTDEEFKAYMLPRPSTPRPNFAYSTHSRISDDLPDSVDWRQKGAVTPIKDQGVCGSCWTFGSTGSLEGMYYLKTGNLISLSEQQLVDCAYLYGSQGCGGGFAASAFQWIIDNGGIATETSYPYLMQNGWCKASKKSKVTVSSYVNVTSGSEADLQDAVANVGPIAIAIDASFPQFRFYSTGVYYQPGCGNGLDDLDHEVLAVGYGTTDQGEDYWIVKNSWSTHYGADGYVLMARNQGNNCGVATCATYPVV
eukprot:TRINITY_DN1440_c0_g4_i1.p1 TRINITY_DN1440_c0_g4~~TRINITY_DN1440_c0_g4_i1.p1  ORF type:complete len:560 (+),score=144.78 TRINITY_DN1440_c0_g4_i1:51-1682(+)